MNTTTIQGAIEALTRYGIACDHDTQSYNMRAKDDGQYIRREAVLAALQVAPAQGSIDTPEFRRHLQYMLDCPAEADVYIDSFIAHIDTHIAQRAASADAPEGFVWVPLRLNPKMVRVMEDDDWAWEDLLAAAEAITEEQHNALAASAPIVDEVAVEPVAWLITGPDGELELGAAYFDKGEADDYIENRAIEGCYLTELIVRPPTPKASAPDAPVADLPPLPKGPYADYDADDMTAYASAAIAQFVPIDDSELIAHADAARAAVAPAGHAEPVAWITKKNLAAIRGKGMAYATGFIVSPDQVALYDHPAPVAAEPAPADPAQPGIDAYTLLAKYMHHVVEVEGVHFICGARPDYLTESEWASLRAVAAARHPVQEGGADE